LWRDTQAESGSKPREIGVGTDCARGALSRRSKRDCGGSAEVTAVDELLECGA
jgi:hypothetical protein